MQFVVSVCEVLVCVADQAYMCQVRGFTASHLNFFRLKSSRGIGFWKCSNKHQSHFYAFFLRVRSAVTSDVAFS